MSSSTVIKVDQGVMAKMSDYYDTHKKAKTPPYSTFSATKNGVTITAYTSGKVMFQGANAEQEAAIWGSALEKKNTAPVSGLPKDFSSRSAIGSDEVGNGSYLGPVVVCASYVDQKHMPLLKELGVKDSKELTDREIKLIAKDIKEVIPYRELIVTPEKYNQIQPDYNVNRMKVALHNQAIHLLLQDLAPLKPDSILIDQFTPEKNYRKYLEREKIQVTDNLYFATKAEQHHLAVAASSIICRASFLEALDQATLELGFTVPSGAGPKSDLAAAKILKRGGMNLLRQYAKLHFANTQKAQNKL
ncbi:ribonuclease HIII [Vagococcus coleopterorum]|uniref:Ribonuclease HIII n=1 Tax=Vagococcus coleopterorum TaxID=2714946 RepID=A0A6G8AKS8_9ENTE|nr:ribonuclease HIII [Vagococcus coleopterorum]QIL45694.1 ribonuclease HIII [Vagococcus coleopterorum]